MNSFNYHGLNEIKNKMNITQKEKLVDYFKNDVLSFQFSSQCDEDNILDEGLESQLDKINFKNSSRGKFLWTLLMAFNYKKEYDFCSWLIEYVETNELLLTATEKNFFYGECINLYYKPRTPEIYNEEKTEIYCLKCIDNFEEYKKEYVEERKDDALKFIDLYTGEEREKRIEDINSIIFNGGTRAYRTLAKLYEKQKRYDEALKICYEAMDIGDDDNTKSGYPGRVDRIKKKMIKQ